MPCNGGSECWSKGAAGSCGEEPGVGRRGGQEGAQLLLFPAEVMSS